MNPEISFGERLKILMLSANFEHVKSHLEIPAHLAKYLSPGNFGYVHEFAYEISTEDYPDLFSFLSGNLARERKLEFEKDRADALSSVEELAKAEIKKHYPTAENFLHINAHSVRLQGGKMTARLFVAERAQGHPSRNIPVHRIC